MLALALAWLQVPKCHHLHRRHTRRAGLAVLFLHQLRRQSLHLVAVRLFLHQLRRRESGQGGGTLHRRQLRLRQTVQVRYVWCHHRRRRPMTPV